MDLIWVTEPNQLTYTATSEPDHEEMIDALADVAYAMYWNAPAFGAPLEEAFELVCENNLEKFVRLEGWSHGEGPLERGRVRVEQRLYSRRGGA